MSDTNNTEGYRFLIFDLHKQKMADVNKQLAGALTGGDFAPSSTVYSPDGRFLTVTLVNNTKATEMLQKLIGGALGGSTAAYSPSFLKGFGDLS